MTEQPDVYRDLAADGDEVDRLVAGLEPDQWLMPTPAPGWTVAHQIAHLSATFHLAALAASDASAFGALAAGLSPDFDANVEAALAPYLAEPPRVLLDRFRQERAAARAALAAQPTDRLVPWLVRPIPAGVLASAGMMELFGHGQDVADALGVRLTRTDRLRHLAGFAARTWDFGYQARGLPTPRIALRFDLIAPSGSAWTFGPADASERIAGPAEDLCLLVTRRRHRDDLALHAVGDEADRWLDVAQAYRGPAGEGRRASARR